MVLLDPILAQVSHDCKHAIPTADDCMFAALVAARMLQAYADKDLRMEAFEELLDNEFDFTLEQAIYGESVTDGSLKHREGF